MIPATLDYIKATSVENAIELLQKHGLDAKLLAGGHSLIPALKLRMATPKYLIDIGGISELKQISKEDQMVQIGALATHAEVAGNATIKENIPLLAQAAKQIGDVQVRNCGTIGGSIAHADPAADYPASILALKAELVLQGPQGKRSVAAKDFFTDLFTTALQAEEILVAIKVPVLGENTQCTYLKYPHPASGYPVVGCAVVAQIENGVCKDIIVALTAVANTAFYATKVEEALKGQEFNEENISKAVANTTEGLDVLNDTFASTEYRTHLANVYTKRALLGLLSA